MPPLPLPHLVRVQQRSLSVVPRIHTHVSPGSSLRSNVLRSRVCVVHA